MQTIKALMAHHPHPGEVTWIGLRPARGEAIEVVQEVLASITSSGLVGDRYASRRSDRRQVTLIQHEHLAAMASFLGRDALDPTILRRNIVVSGINLLALKNARFRIGDAILEGTGLCHPCSKMEVALGPGGYNATRGHGGLTARVVEDGMIRVGDEVVALPG